MRAWCRRELERKNLTEDRCEKKSGRITKQGEERQKHKIRKRAMRESLPDLFSFFQLANFFLSFFNFYGNFFTSCFLRAEREIERGRVAEDTRVLGQKSCLILTRVVMLV